MSMKRTSVASRASTSRDRACTLGILGAFLALAGTSPADWLQFRGGDGAALPDDPRLPVELDAARSIAWKVELPGEGLASPIVIGDRVVLTAASGPDQALLHVRCLSDDDGAVLWERRFRASGRTMHHETTSVAAPSPCSDGERIFALFSTNDLVSLDLDGNLLWLRGLTYDYPNASNSLGLATSPVVVGDTLVVQIENDSDSFVAGLDVKTGLNKWKRNRTKRANWCSPVIVRDPESGERLVALQGSSGVDVISPGTGETVWTYTDGASTIPSSAAGDGMLFIPSRGLTALRLKGGSTFEQAWQEQNLGPGTASPVAHGDKVYVVNNAGVLTCAESATGERLWRTRLEGPFSGSPVIAGKYLYIFSERDGKAQVVDLSGDEGVVVGSLDLGDKIQSTPALANGALYIRSDRHLWKITKG